MERERDDSELDDDGRIFIAVVWLLAGAALIWLPLSGSPALLALPGVDPRAAALLLAPLVLAGVAGLAVSAALFLRWPQARHLVAIVTWPLTVLFAWALVWCVVALMGAVDSDTVGATVAVVLVLVLMSRTRRVARALAAGEPAPPASSGERQDIFVTLAAAGGDEGVPQEYRWIAENLPGGKIERQALVQREGRHYDRFEVRLPDGSTQRVFFDISAWFGG